MTESTGVGFGARKAKQPVSALATLSRYICTYAEGWGREVILLSLGGNAISYTWAPKGMKNLSLCAFADPQIVQSAPELYTCLLSRNKTTTQALHSSQAKRLLKFQ